MQNHDTIKRTASPAEPWHSKRILVPQKHDSQNDCQYCRNMRLKNSPFPNNETVPSVLSMAAKSIPVYLKPCATGSSYRVTVTGAWSWHSPPSSAAIPLLPLYALLACTGTTLPSPEHKQVHNISFNLWMHTYIYCKNSLEILHQLIQAYQCTRPTSCIWILHINADFVNNLCPTSRKIMFYYIAHTHC